MTYAVTGMTCEHCVRAVTSELGEIDGVSGVSVDLTPGGVSRVTVTSAAPLLTGAVAAALDEAGYRMHDQSRKLSTHNQRIARISPASA